MTDTLTPRRAIGDLGPNPSTTTIPAVEEDVLDWDAVIETPPSRPTGIIQVKLEHGGRGRPTPVTDPSAD